MEFKRTRDKLAIPLSIVVAGLLIAVTLFAALGQPSRTSTQTVVESLTSTSTETSVSTVTSTETTTSTASCDGSFSGSYSPQAADNFTTDCGAGLTLSVAADPEMTVGTNETVYVSLQNDFSSPKVANASGFTNIPPGLDSNIAEWEDVEPQIPQCGAIAQGYVVVYNGTGSLLMLQDQPDVLTELCINALDVGSVLNGSATVTRVLSLGGYWTSPDVTEPWVNGTYHQLGPGKYTVAAFDSWGQITTLNFTVSPVSYAVTFRQLPCAGDYEVPWSVTLGNLTESMPPGSAVPPPGSAELQGDPGASAIVFSVVPGSYAYIVLPAAGFSNTENTTGKITVTNADVTVQLQAACHP